MYDFMDRTAIVRLRKKDWSIRKISREYGVHRDTVRRLLREPLDKGYQRPEYDNAATPYREEIVDWLAEGLTVTRMLEKVQELAEPRTYTGSRSAFFAGVAKIREQVEADTKRRYVRFEGLPGEYAQVDWGEIRDMRFQRGEPRTKYFLAVRLKYSRALFVKWTDSMTQEVLLRGLVEAFEHFGGVPWVLVFDNMKTVTVGRDDHGRPIWHPVLKHFANDFDFKPEACDRACGNQKGAVENLVGWVKSNFVKGRRFLDEADLERQCRDWMAKCNGQVSQAHGEVPWEVLPEEQAKFGNLHCSAAEYGLLRQVCSNRDGWVHVEGFQYLIPIGLAEQPLTVRIRGDKVEFYHLGERVVGYSRRTKDDGKPTTREFRPDLLEPILKDRPKARVVVYRDYLCQAHPELAAYIASLCRARRGHENYGPHILKLYRMLLDKGLGELVAACNLAAGEGALGADYVAALLQEPSVVRPLLAELRLGEEVPDQDDLDRDLSFYENFAIGGDAE